MFVSFAQMRRPNSMQAPPPDAVLPANVYLDDFRGRTSTTPRHPSPTSACLRNALASISCPAISVGMRVRARSSTLTILPRPDNGELEASEIGTQVHQILAGIPVEAPAAESVELADRFLTSALGKRASRQHESSMSTTS